MPRHRPSRRSSASAASYDWRDVIDIVTAHRNHAPFLVGKLWSYFITEPLDASTKARLVRIYRSKKLAIKPVVAEILAHPKLYANLDRPDMVKSPLVFLAGTLRTNGLGRRAPVVDLAARRHGPGAVPPAVGRRLGLGPAPGCRRTR